MDQHFLFKSDFYSFPTLKEQNLDAAFHYFAISTLMNPIFNHTFNNPHTLAAMNI